MRTLAIFSQIVVFVSSLRVNRPRGVSLSNKSFYENKEWFTCIDGSAKIPFKYLNDDFCDCKDGTDEPGTPACPNGKFHCGNAGFLPKYIPSSRVNDGICDCCDASDEYESGAGCFNTCKELGREERQKKKKKLEMQNQGFQIRQQYIEQGKLKREERQKKIEELEQQLEIALEEKKIKETLKEEIEKPEVEAKKREEDIWEEEIAKKREEKEREMSKLAFHQLDKNDNHAVGIQEIQIHTELDKNEDGAIDENEAKEILAGFEAVDLKMFIENVWPSIKEKIIIDIEKDADTKHMESKKDTPDANEFGDGGLDGDGDDYIDPDYDDPDYEEDSESIESDSAKYDNEPEPQIEYSQEVKELIQNADKAREEYKEASEKHKAIEKEINELNKFLNINLGNEDEFTTIQEQCFEYEDREYTYKMCSFNKVSQKPKSGRETNLGNWGQWGEHENNEYSKMKYTGGEKCWNGPERSTTVTLLCGVENKVISASEPNRCEYALEFTTPAMCTQFVEATDLPDDTHDEL